MDLTKELFTKCWLTNGWGDGIRSPKSGDGSSLQYTANLRAHMPEIFEKFQVKTFLDSPCGDLTWMPSVLETCDVNYIASDIVDEMIDEHRQRFSDKPWTFLVGDICKDPFPVADMWMCRDVLFHLPIELSLDAMRNFARSEIKYALITTHCWDTVNYNGTVYTGNRGAGPEFANFELINLFDAPYNFPDPPLYRVDDTFGPHPKREMCVWSREQIAEALSF